MVHQYKLNGYNIVLDTCSGSVHCVDEVAYDIIAMYKNAEKEEIVSAMLEKYGEREDVTREDLLACLDDVAALEEAGKLFSEDQYEKLAFDYKNNSNVVKALCLHIAHTCNLNCSYCFASQGKYQGERALMSFEVGKQAFDFLNKEMSNVVLSLDGRRDVHDHFRKDYKGNGSYDLILPKFKNFVEKREGKNYYMRGTFTHNNTDFTKDIFHMADMGFTELSMEPVVCPPGDPYALTNEDLPKLFEEYEILAKEMIKRKKEGRPFTFYHYMLDLKNGPCIYKRITGCGSGTEYMAVTPWGELFPCHQFVGDEKYSLGNIWDGVKNTAIQEEFRKCNAYSRPECDKCWARLYCSGGCAANSYHATGSISGVYEYGCELFKKRIECAIMMQIAEEEE